MAAEQTPPTSSVQFDRTEDFIARYANNVHFESSVWDLKLIFGELDQKEAKEVVRQHTSINLPWPTVKLMLYYLQVNLAYHESESGKVTMAPRIWPADIPTLPKEIEDNPRAKALADLVAKMRADFVASVSK